MPRVRRQPSPTPSSDFEEVSYDESRASVVSHNPALRAHGWAGALRGCGASIEDALNEAVGDVLQFELRPQLRLKLRKRTPWLSLGANVEAGEPGVELVAKRGTRPQGGLALWKLVRRVVVSPAKHVVRVHRRARVSVPLGWLALEGVVTHDWASHRSRLAWRLGAAWDVSPTHVGTKLRLPSPVPARLVPSSRWEVRALAATRVGGELGGDASVACEVGHYAVSLPNIQLAINL